MPDPDTGSLTWVRDALDLREPVVVVRGMRGMRDGGSPWLLQTIVDGAIREVVLGAADAASVRTQEAALGYARTHGIPAPAPLGATMVREQPKTKASRIAKATLGPFDKPQGVPEDHTPWGYVPFPAR